jgi:trimethylamine--corrinoid protein Co-methyltransferase
VLPPELPSVLAEEVAERIHATAMRILEEIGIEVRHPGVRSLLRDRGQLVEGERVRFDRGFVLEMVARAPTSFTLRGRGAGREVTIGTGRPVLAPTGGAPLASDLERGRREGTIEDHHRLVKLAHAAEELEVLHSGTCEATDVPLPRRHLEMDYSVLRYSDKPFVCYGTSGSKARDAIAMAAIARGGREEIERTPAILGVVNPSSPLVWDARMAGALVAWAEAAQPVIVTPFLLGGGTAPVTLAGGLALQVAEALSGVAIAQAVRPGAPCLFGSFLAPLDMRTGSPAFGTPGSVQAVMAGAQLARRYGLPFRGGGALTSSNAVDAQAAAESANMLWATFLAGADLVLHAAGWLEGGRTASFEKFALDLELVAILRWIRERRIEASEDDLALEALREVGPGGTFLASPHTRARFKDLLYRPRLFRATDAAGWELEGAPTIDRLAHEAWRRALESYEDPGIDPAVDEALRDYVDRRAAEPAREEA